MPHAKAVDLSITWEQNLEAVMPDGTVLRADVWRPAKPGRYPTLLIREPYGKRQAENITYAHPSWYAQQGFAVVAQDVRGRFDSEGEFVPFEHEASDGATTVDWVAEQAFCNGAVGMYGFSYGGATQLQAAARRARRPAGDGPRTHKCRLLRGLDVQARGPLAGVHRLVGIHAQRRDGSPQRRRDAGEPTFRTVPEHGLFGTLPLTQYPNLGAGDTGTFFHEWLSHPTNDDYWRRWDVTERLSQVPQSALMVAGLYDIFLDSTLRAYASLRTRPSALRSSSSHPGTTFRGHAMLERSTSARAHSTASSSGTSISFRAPCGRRAPVPTTRRSAPS